MNKKACLVVVILMIFAISLTSVSAVSTNFPNSGLASTTVVDSANNAWKTVVTIVQILAFAAIVFAGVRYMFASADQKADIKKGLGILTVGAVLVFAAATVVSFIYNSAEEIL